MKAPVVQEPLMIDGYQEFTQEIRLTNPNQGGNWIYSVMREN
jgi:hypothetical protein